MKRTDITNRIYEVHSHALRTKHLQVGMRMQVKYHQAIWKAIWTNITAKTLSLRIRSIWYAIVHDIVPTNSRLHDINLHETGNCQYCGTRDTIIHRFTECIEAKIIWSWIQKNVACYLRMNSWHVPNTWITLPDFEIYPLQRHNATIWMIGHMIGYIYDNPSLTQQDFLDFLKRTRWKEYSRRSQFKDVGII
jgi:hypothetical protein